MKKLVILLVIIPVILGCVTTGEIFGDNLPEYLRDDSGSSVVSCLEKFDPNKPPTGVALPKSNAVEYWKKNNLPKGTLYWVCEGDKAVLPKDCQGNSLTTPQLRQYWKQYNLPIGTKEFNCSGGTPNNVREEIAPTLITNRDIKRQIT